MGVPSAPITAICETLWVTSLIIDVSNVLIYIFCQSDIVIFNIVTLLDLISVQYALVN